MPVRKLAAIVSVVALALLAPAGPAAAGGISLFDAMMEFQPEQYWVLDDQGSPAVNSIQGALPLAPAGAGAAITFHTASHPFGGNPASVRLNATGPRSGQYLRSATHLTPVSKPGTIVIWFRLPTALRSWTQVLAVDNGAYSGTAGGLMISKDGRLLSADVTGFVDFRSKRTLNDGRWHCVAWADTLDKSSPDSSQWTGSTLYLDGVRLTTRLIATWTPRLGVFGSRLLVGDGGPHEARGIGSFAGNISNVAIYEGPLAPQDIGFIWDAGHGSGA